MALHRSRARFLLWCATVSLSAACGDAGLRTGAPAGDAAIATTLTLADFTDGTWVLSVDRTLRANPGISLPMQPLTEQDYEPASPKTEHTVTVSMKGLQVSVDQPPRVGDRVSANGSQLSFDLQTGTFAGGRFLVWQASGGLQAELTIYGSGVPVASSERGELRRIKRPAA
jgi:hypothetical protein